MYSDIGSRTHGFDSLVIFALGVKHPGGCDLRLDLDLPGPIGILRVAQLVS